MERKEKSEVPRHLDPDLDLNKLSLAERDAILKARKIQLIINSMSAEGGRSGYNKRPVHEIPSE